MPVPDARVEMQIGGAWTDISSDVYFAPGISHTRGRSGEGSRVDPAVVNVQLKSPNGKYTPRNPNSENFGLIGRNAPVRISVAGAEPHLANDGAVFTTRGASTPDGAVLDITGDLDVRFDAGLDNWQASGLVELMGKGLNAGSQRSWLLMLNSGFLRLEWSADGANMIQKNSTAAIPVPANRRLVVRATLDVNNGAAGNTVTFYTGTSLSGPWTQLGSPVVTAATTSIFNSTAPLLVGQAMSDVGFASASGKIYRAEVRSGIGGTVVANPDFTVQAPGATGFTDAAGRVWSVLAGSSISDRTGRLSVEIPTWTPAFTVSGDDMNVPIQGGGILRRLGQGQKALASTLRRRIPAYGPIAYWPLEEGKTSTQAYSPLAGVNPMKVSGLDFAAVDTLAGSSPLPVLTPTSVLSTRIPTAADGEWQVELVYNLEAMPASQTTMLLIRTSGTAARMFVRIQTNNVQLQGQNADGSETFLISLTSPGFTGAWNRLKVGADTSGGNVTAHLGWVTIGESAAGSSTTYAGTAGHVTSLDTSPGAALDGMGIGHISVFDVREAGAYDYADHGFTAETAGARALRLTSEESVPFTLVGDYDDQTPMGPQRPDTLLNLLAECEASDGGILYEDRTQLGLVYRGRTDLYNQAPALTIPYSQLIQPFVPVDDDTRIRNDVTRTRNGGSSARVVREDGPLSVQPPPLGVGTYDETQTLSLSSDSQPEQIAAWAMHLGTWDEARYKQVRILLHQHPDLIPAVTALDIGDIIRITDMPSFLPPGPVDLMVEGYREDLTGLTWEAIFNCSPAGPWTVGVLENPVLGKADTGGSELTSSVTSSDTSLSITTTGVWPWVTDPQEYPFDLTVGGEVVTAVAAGGVINENPLLLTEDTTAWVPAASTLAYSTAVVHTERGATGSILMTPNGGVSAVGLNADPHSPVGTITPGASYTMCGWVYSPAGWADMRVVTDWYTSADALISTSPSVAVVVPAATWTYIEVTATAPALASRSRVRGRQGLTPTGTDISYWWNVRLIADASVSTTSPQLMTVVRSVNGIVKAQTAGTSLSLTHPMRAAL